MIPQAMCKGVSAKHKGVALASLIVSALAGFAPSAQADYITNGQFSTTNDTGTFGTYGGGLNTVGDYTTGGSLNGWTVADVSGSSGFALMFLNGPQGSTTANDGNTITGRFGSFSLYDPGNTTSGTLGAIPNTSPGGGNFIAMDGAVGYQVALYQTLTNLSPNTTYALSFWYAAGQQYGKTGSTTEGLQVSLLTTPQLTQITTPNGTTTQVTPAQPLNPLPQGGFQAWAQDVMFFTTGSNATTEVLTFLGVGTPSGEPPMNLLSDVTLVATPEPVTEALLGAGLFGLVAIVRLRRKRVLNP